MTSVIPVSLSYALKVALLPITLHSIRRPTALLLKGYIYKPALFCFGIDRAVSGANYKTRAIKFVWYPWTAGRVGSPFSIHHEARIRKASPNCPKVREAFLYLLEQGRMISIINVEQCRAVNQ